MTRDIGDLPAGEQRQMGELTRQHRCCRDFALELADRIRAAQEAACRGQDADVQVVVVVGPADHSGGLQRGQDGQHGRLRQPEAGRDLGQRPAAWPLRDQVQDGHRAGHRR